MPGGGTAGSTGQPRPGTRGEAYGREVSETVGDTERVFAIGTESLSFLIQAHPDNSGNIYIGWDDNVDSNSGVVLEPGNTISMDIDLENQNIWAFFAAANDELRYIVLG